MNTGIRLVRVGCLLLVAGCWLGATPVQVMYNCTSFYGQFSTGSPLSVAGEIVCPTFDGRLGTLIQLDESTYSYPVTVGLVFELADQDGSITLRNTGTEAIGCGRWPFSNLVCADVFYITGTLGPLAGQQDHAARTVWAGVEAIGYGQGSVAPGETRTLLAMPSYIAYPQLVPGANLAPFVSLDGSGTFAVPVQIDVRAAQNPFQEVTEYSFRHGASQAWVSYDYETPEPGTLGMIVLAGVGAVVSRRLLHRAR